MAETTRKRGRAAAGAPVAPSFGAALDEVEAILARLEREEVDVDDLAREVGRAVELIGLCRRKLAATELEVRGFVDALEADEAPGEGGEAGDPAPRGGRGEAGRGEDGSSTTGGGRLPL